MKSLLKSGLRKLGYQLSRHVDPFSIVPPYVLGLRHACGDAEGTVIFDVGAHHGHTENLLRSNFPAATIHCFEPFTESFEILQSNISGRSKAHNFGFSEAAGLKTFQSNQMAVTNSLLPLETRAAEIWGLSELRYDSETTCRFETIDGFLQANAISQIDLLKIDTQGSEYLVLEGASDALHSKAIKNVFLEIITAPTYTGQKPFAYYIDFFDRAGFKLRGLYEQCYNANGELLQLDALFSLK